MVVKVYISGISGNKEVKKRQQRVLMILDSKNIKYELIDITEPGRDADKDFMQANSKANGGTVSDPNPRHPLPPQIFNDDEYCGDYDQFDMANEVDTLEQFLKMEVPPEEPAVESDEKDKAINGEVNGEQTKGTKSKENSQERDAKESTPAKEGTPEKEDILVENDKDGHPTKESTPVKEGTPANDGTVDQESTLVEEGTPARDATSNKEGTPSTKEFSRETTPANDNLVIKDANEQQADQDEVLKKSEASIENTLEKEEINENGKTSSREPSSEKHASSDKNIDPSVALIESEKATAE